LKFLKFSPASLKLLLLTYFARIFGVLFYVKWGISPSYGF
jgi:hypothetical protein